MPELPEVETIKRDLEKKLIGLAIEEVEIFDTRVIKNSDIKIYQKRLTGAKIENVARRGKSLVIGFDNGWHLFIQVKMTGYLVYGAHLRLKKSDTETKVVFKLSNGRFLNYNDHRTFGWLYLIKDLERVPYLNSIGPEPLEDGFNPQWLSQALSQRKAPIKTLLMNQHFLAGIGNIYASEILFSAGVHPRKAGGLLSKKEISALHGATKKILIEAIDCRGTSMRNYRDTDGREGRFWNRIKVYGRENQNCYRCQNLVQRLTQGGRSTFFCAHCQKM